MENLFENGIALISLTLMEIVLGIDNIVFIAILTGKLPERRRALARRIGLLVAMLTRVLLLLTLSWILKLTDPVFMLTGLGIPEQWLTDASGDILSEINDVSWRDVIMLVGGLFLIGKSVHEIHGKFNDGHDDQKTFNQISFSKVIAEIAVLDIIFSLDSVITAVGMARELWVMITAVIIAVGVMMIFAGRISDFVEKHPTLKMLALSFLILIGVMLVAEATGAHIDKGYVYFAMAFALGVEMINLRLEHARKRKTASSSKTM